eukprot:7330304-Prorocentrum_lima.AAC.1
MDPRRHVDSWTFQARTASELLPGARNRKVPYAWPRDVCEDRKVRGVCRLYQHFSDGIIASS